MTRARNFSIKGLSLALILAMTFCAFQPLQVFAEKSHSTGVQYKINLNSSPVKKGTFEEQINALELVSYSCEFIDKEKITTAEQQKQIDELYAEFPVNSKKVEEIREKSITYRKALNKVIKKDMTNYQKLRAAYDYTVKYNKLFHYDCVVSSFNLKDSFEYVGVRAVQINGETRSANGGWVGHKWVGVVLNGNIYYFDSDLPAAYGVSPDKCFAIPVNKATIYRDGVVFNEYSPDIREEFYYKVK